MAAQLACSDDKVNNDQLCAEIITPDYDCFHRIPFFIAATSNKTFANSKLAAVWANTIFNYWQTGLADGTTDLSKPIYILDVLPSQGKLVWILNELKRCIGASRVNFQFCYLNCYKNANDADDTANHSYFGGCLTAGEFDVAYWDEANSSLHLQYQNIVLQQCDNPLVILGLNYFQTLGSELVGIHNGKLLRGSAAITSVNEDQGSYEFDYQWQTNPEPLIELADPLLAHYRQQCNGSTFTLPLRACEHLEALNKFAGGRTLLLAADAGVSNTQQIRLGALCPPATWCKQDPAPPVNFHAISLHQQLQGAHVWQQQLDDKGTVLHMAWRDDKHPVSAKNFNELVATFAEAHPDDIHQLVTRQHDVADILPLLRLSHYDPQLLETNIAALLEQPLVLTDSARRNWQEALVRTWCNYLPTKAYDDFYYQLGLLAAQVGHFGLAKECFRIGLTYYGDEANDLYLLAWCEAESGGLISAMELLKRALELQPEHPQSVELFDLLKQRLKMWQQYPWYLPQHVHEPIGSLILEPLGEEHAASLLYQYRDPQISIMTRLPELETIEQVTGWINEQQQEKSRACFAVIHESWGFVGLVSAHCAGNAGYFYFWIGSDFQGQGFGQQSAQMLFEVIAQQGVTEIFTSAYEDNLRSIHALTQLGFSKLSVRAKESDESLEFFYQAQSETQADNEPILTATLIELCRAIDSPLQLL